MTTAKVQDHQHMNKLIRQAKRDADYSLWIHAIPMNRLAFGSFSDASWGISPDGSSQGGMLIFASDSGLFQGQTANLSLMDWKSWALKRKCRSSLSAESQAAADTIDVLNFVRLFAADLLVPIGVDLRRTDEILSMLPSSILVTD